MNVDFASEPVQSVYVIHRNRGAKNEDIELISIWLHVEQARKECEKLNARLSEGLKSLVRYEFFEKEVSTDS